MRRIYRNDMSQTQKDKISAKNKGRRLSQTTRLKISRSLARYWSRLPYKPETGSTETSWDKPGI